MEENRISREFITDFDLLARAQECWNSLREFRAERDRCKRFTCGDQWGDFVEDNGVRIREYEYIRRQGNMPLKNNLIRRLVRNVLGVYRNQWSAPRCEGVAGISIAEVSRINRLLGENMEFNRLEELYARTMEEFLIGGLVVHKKWYGRRQRESGCRTDMVAPDCFFFDTASRDFRGSDVSIVGEVHEIRFGELIACFAKSPADIENLQKIYGLRAGFDGQELCSLYEVWDRRKPMLLQCHDRRDGRLYSLEADRQPQVEADNTRRRAAGQPEISSRWIVDERWHYSFIAPTGHVISSGRSPYSHGSHPYVFKAYPFIDGEIHSFVGDIIDQQKLTNRLISMYDWILRASAKGVLLFPEGALPDGVDINDIADEWGRFNGVIVYRPRAGVPLPQQVSSKSTDVGITELLEIQMKMMEDISGVNGALQGKLESNSMSGTLYSQQTRNSMTALVDLLKCFDDFIAEATRMDISNLRQFEGRAGQREILRITTAGTDNQSDTGSVSN